MEDALGVLKRYFGYASFRAGQEDVVRALLSGRDTLAVMPTGAGKSLCYQVPALMREGVTLVISPLVSLMKDQVTNLVQNGVKAAYVNSALTPAQIGTVLARAERGAYRIIYVAPERLESPAFLRFARNAAVDFVAVDEAHCVSKWGQDFRPAYLNIAPFVESLPRRPVMGAFTATATDFVREDTSALLGLRDPYVIVTGFDRKNLFYEVRHPSNRRAELLSIVGDLAGKSGIVYCATRRNVERVHELLVERGFSATRYHAGLTEAERARNQEEFAEDRAAVMVATNAFGMGIDKSNVSYVIHYNMPGDMESYYQEAGRAGRDGTPARCVLFCGEQDMRTQLFFIERMGEDSRQDADTVAELRRLARRRLDAMYEYCFTTDCLRRYILRYFGEKAPETCGYCGNCTRTLETVDMTVDAQKILSCVARAKESWGAKVIADILRGSTAEKLRRNGLDKLSTWGIMKDVPEGRLRDMIGFLVKRKYLSFTGKSFPLLRLGEKAREILRGQVSLTAGLPAIETRGERTALRRDRREQLSARTRPELYERLRETRLRIARSRGIPAYMVFSNATLEDMSMKLPRNMEELLLVSGVGHKKAEEYGELFLEVLRTWEDTGR